MTQNEYSNLVEFIGIKFDRVDFRFTALEDRLTRVEVGYESFRDNFRALVDGVLGNSRRIEKNGRRIEQNGRRIEQNGVRIDALATEVGTLTTRVDGLTSEVGTLTTRFDALETSVSTRFDDHEGRITSLE